eukprot:TRINITY_DN3913_c0_g1_i9.p1 TRINITY_DN3913_c0_g1~~TRINITY_DN3913_c0_g1_i9.p1  ORF type:complete len:590 (+),score=85.04 TRINITY_DN3913_c0_g1_i9:73-1842(+)
MFTTLPLSYLPREIQYELLSLLTVVDLSSLHCISHFYDDFLQTQEFEDFFWKLYAQSVLNLKTISNKCYTWRKSVLKLTSLYSKESVITTVVARCVGTQTTGLLEQILEIRHSEINFQQQSFIFDCKYPLHKAVLVKNLGLIRLLIAYGCRLEEIYRHKTVRDLVEQCCDLNVILEIVPEKAISNPQNFFHVLKMGTEDNAIVMLNLGVQIFDKFSSDGLTALHAAAKYGKLRVVKQLLSMGMPLNHQVGEYSVFDMAAISGNYQICEFLVKEKNWDPNFLTKKGKNGFHYACLGGNLNVVKFLLPYVRNGVLNTVAETNETCLHLVARCTSTLYKLCQTTKYLIRSGADMNLRDSAGYTPVMVAGKYGNVDMVKQLIDFGADPLETLIPALTKNRFRIIDMLLKENYISINDPVHVPALRALQYASLKGYQNVFWYLMSRYKDEIDWTLIDPLNGFSVFHYLFVNRELHYPRRADTYFKLFKEFLHKGANPNHRNNKGCLPLCISSHLTPFHKECMVLLIQLNAFDLDCLENASIPRYSPTTLEFCLDHGCHVPPPHRISELWSFGPNWENLNCMMIFLDRGIFPIYG